MRNILKVEMTDFADVGQEERQWWILNESQALGLSKEMVVPLNEMEKKKIWGWKKSNTPYNKFKLSIRHLNRV